MSPNPKPSGNGKDTRYKGGKNPPPKELPDIVTAFSEYFGNFPYFSVTAKKIEKKYNIERDEDGFWEDDDIKRVWGKTTRLYTYSKRRKTLCLVTMLEMLKKLLLTKNTPSEETETQPDVNSDKSPEIKESNSSDTAQISPKTCYIRIPLSVMDDDYDNSDDDYDHSDDNQLPEPTSQTEQAETEQAQKKQPQTKKVQTEQQKNKTTKDLPYKLINGLPSLTKTTRKTSYVLQYNNHTRNATWAFEILNKDSLKKNALHKNDYIEDRSVNYFFRTPPSKWNEIDHDKGHLVAAGNHIWDQNAVNDTNMISNIVPQKKTHNAEIWNQLEERCRRYTNDARNVLVYTGPLYCPSENLRIQQKAVPTALFKVVILEYENKKNKVECYIIPYKYDSKKLNDYTEPLEEIEKQSGLVFSKKMPTIQLTDEEVRVRFKPQNKEEQNKEEQNNEGQNKEQKNKGIEIKLKVTPYKKFLFGSTG